MAPMPSPTSDRAAFLQRLRGAVPAPTPLPPPYTSPARPGGDLPARFRAATERVGGRLLDLPDMRALSAALDAMAPAERRVVDPTLPATGRPLDGLSTAHDAPEVDLVVMRGCVGVAEDGAVLVADLDRLGRPEARLRALPFLAEHLVLVLRVDALVADLHAALALPRVRRTLDAAGFAVWIAGPSKTADIEQTLVLGAHGPAASTVLLVHAP